MWSPPSSKHWKNAVCSHPPWAPQDTAIGLDKARANYPSITGSGESIAVIDTGVDYNASELGGGFGPGYKVEAGYNFINGTGNPYPLSGVLGGLGADGTGPADVIGDNLYTYQGHQYEGVAPGANIIALAEDNTYQVQSALNWVITNRTKYNIVAVNITDFGGGPWNTYVTQLNTLISDGVYITFPAGNTTSYVTTQMTSGIMNVGSCSPTSLALSSFSSYGPDVPLLAPGQDMTLPYLNSSNGQQCIVAVTDGTSWAAPQVAATAALLKEINPKLSVAQMTQMIEQSGTPTYSGGRTYKVLNVNGAIALAYASLKSPAPAPAPAPASPVVAHLTFVQQPTNGVTDAPIPTVTVEATTASGNPVSGVTIHMTAYTGPATGGNITAITNAKGIATFSGDMVLDTAGQYTLQVYDGSIRSAASNSFAVRDDSATANGRRSGSPLADAEHAAKLARKERRERAIHNARPGHTPPARSAGIGPTDTAAWPMPGLL